MEFVPIVCLFFFPSKSDVGFIRFEISVRKHPWIHREAGELWLCVYMRKGFQFLMEKYENGTKNEKEEKSKSLQNLVFTN